MKAAIYSTYGGSEVVEIKDVQKPSLKEGQVLVEVHAASLNPFDYKLRLGYMKDGIPLKFPVTLAGDFAGIVSEVFSGVTEFQVGDEVYGQALIVNGGSGSLAEFAAANTKNTSKKPKKITFPEASSLVLVGISAIQALEEQIKLEKGQKILIHGGAGGIGSVAIQIAKHLGAYVAATVSTDDMEFAKELGADEVIDYKTQEFDEIVTEFDAVFDTVGGETVNKSFAVLKKGGILVTMAALPDQELAKKHGVIAVGQMSGVTAARLARLTELVEQGVIEAQIGRVFPLDEAREAFQYLEKDSPRGKVVVRVKE